MIIMGWIKPIPITSIVHYRSCVSKVVTLLWSNNSRSSLYRNPASLNINKSIGDRYLWLLTPSRLVACEKQFPTISFRKLDECSRKVMVVLIRNTSILSKLYLSYINLQEGLLKVPSGSIRGPRPRHADSMHLKLPLLALSCLLHPIVSSLINALEAEYLCLC